jgi:hypothetical protein
MEVTAYSEIVLKMLSFTDKWKIEVSTYYGLNWFYIISYIEVLTPAVS